MLEIAPFRTFALLIALLWACTAQAGAQQDWNSGCLNMDPDACGEAIWQSYAGNDPVGNALNGSIGDIMGGGFHHRTPEEIAACIQLCEDHWNESSNACRSVYGSAYGDADFCLIAVRERYDQCVAQCNN